MAKLDITLDDMANDLVFKHIKSLCQQAYEKGVQDGIEKYSYPPILKNTHLEEIFQVKSAAVTKLTGIASFPRLKNIQARYPRDLVFEWIKQNSNWVAENTNYFKKGAS